MCEPTYCNECGQFRDETGYITELEAEVEELRALHQSEVDMADMHAAKVEKLREALEQIVAVLPEGECRVNECEGCRYEMQDARREAVAALYGNVEAEPVVVTDDGLTVRLVMDDGSSLEFDRDRLLAALNQGEGERVEGPIPGQMDLEGEAA